MKLISKFKGSVIPDVMHFVTLHYLLVFVPQVLETVTLDREGMTVIMEAALGLTT